MVMWARTIFVTIFLLTSRLEWKVKKIAEKTAVDFYTLWILGFKFNFSYLLQSEFCTQNFNFFPPFFSDAFHQIIRDEGVVALWNGTFPSLLLVFNPAIQFMFYEGFKRKLLKKQLQVSMFWGQVMDMLSYKTGSLACVTWIQKCRFVFGSCVFEVFFELVYLLKRVCHHEVRLESFISLGKIFLWWIPLPVKIKLHLLSTFV